MAQSEALKRYRELSNEQPAGGDYFFAFSKEQFQQGYDGLVSRGVIKQGEKICSAGNALFGTRAGLDKMFEFYRQRRERISRECDPQVVYDFEFANYECEIDYDGDANAMKHVIETFGIDRARQVTRRCALYSLEALQADNG